jgi:hypothetical protein
VDPVPDPLLLRKSGSAGNRTRDLWIYSQELWPLDHRGGPLTGIVYSFIWKVLDTAIIFYEIQEQIISDFIQYNISSVISYATIDLYADW